MDFLLPASIGAGLLTHWLVDEGSSVYAGQPVAIVVTDTVEYILPAPEAGVLNTFYVDAGDDVDVDAVLADVQVQQPVRGPRLTPVAQAMVVAHELDVAELVGSGPDGRILKRDIAPLLGLAAPQDGFCVAEQIGNALEQAAIVVPRKAPAATPAPAARSAPRESSLLPQPALLPLSSAPTARLAITIDAVVLQQRLKQSHQSLGRFASALDHVTLISYALAQTLAAHPQLRVCWSDDGLIQRAATHLMVQTTHGSQMIANAADYSLKGLAQLLVQPPISTTEQPVCQVSFAEHAFWSDARLPEGYSLSLHVGALRKLPIVQVQAGIEQVTIGATYTLTLTYDARAISDVQAHEFLQHLQAFLLA